MKIEQEFNNLKNKKEIPEWMTLPGYKTLSKGYRLKGETPKGMYNRTATSAAKSGNFNEKLRLDFFDVMWKNWLCPASPVLSNLGTDRGLPISCFGLSVEDKMEDIMGRGIGELAMLTKSGGGVGVGFNNIRCSGSLIRGGRNGKSDGIIPFAKVYDSAILGSRQGDTRRGSAVVNLNIEHGDWNEFVRMRRPEGDLNRQCGNLHQSTVIHDEFMYKVKNGNRIAREKWTELLKTRLETGEPYILFNDNVNRNNPDAYKNNGLEVDMTNLCSEIMLHADGEHSFICCLSSLNLARYNEWKNWKSKRTNLTLPQISIYFLNGVLDEFINKARYLPYLDKAVRSAEKGRAVGLGVLGWHTFLQENLISFESYKAMQLNNEIHKFIKEESVKASKELAKSRKEPKWCKGTGMYNSHLLAIAPTRSNSIISGDVSPGIEPIIANTFTDNTAKGTFVRKNKTLIAILKKLNKNNEELWKDISNKNGSVQHLNFLSE